MKIPCVECHVLIRPKTTGLCCQCWRKFLRGYWDDAVKQRLATNSVANSNGCIEWSGGKDKDGYGRIRYQGKDYKAHRLSYKLEHPEWDESTWILHSCDNPSCINTIHLRQGDQLDNMGDMLSRNRHRYLGKKGSEHHKSKLTEMDVIEIRRKRAEGESLSKISLHFGVCQAAISLAARGKTWAHI